MPNGTQASESFDLWALKERYKSEITQLYDVWRIYIAWYTVFLTFNVAALVFYKQVVDGSGSGLRRLLIGLFFVLQNGCAVVTSVLMARFSTRSYAALEAVLTRLGDLMPEPRNALDMLTKQRPLIPRDLMILGAWFNVSGPGSLAIIWLLLTFAVPPPTAPSASQPANPAPAQCSSFNADYRLNDYFKHQGVTRSVAAPPTAEA